MLGALAGIQKGKFHVETLHSFISSSMMSRTWTIRVQPLHIGAAEEEALLPVALHRLNESVSDTKGNLGRGTPLDTLGALGGSLPQALLQPLHQGSAYRTARHAHRAVDNGQIALFGLKKYVLIALGGIALVGGDKAGGKLHARGSQLSVPARSAPVYTPPATKTGMGWPYFSS